MGWKKKEATHIDAKNPPPGVRLHLGFERDALSVYKTFPMYLYMLDVVQSSRTLFMCYILPVVTVSPCRL